MPQQRVQVERRGCETEQGVVERELRRPERPHDAGRRLRVDGAGIVQERQPAGPAVGPQHVRVGEDEALVVEREPVRERAGQEHRHDDRRDHHRGEELSEAERPGLIDRDRTAAHVAAPAHTMWLVPCSTRSLSSHEDCEERSRRACSRDWTRMRGLLLLGLLSATVLATAGVNAEEPLACPTLPRFAPDGARRA